MPSFLSDVQDLWCTYVRYHADFDPDMTSMSAGADPGAKSGIALLERQFQYSHAG